MPDLPHAYGFDPTYGYAVERMLTIQPPAEPDDFAPFWRRTYAEARDTPLRLTAEDVPSSVPGFRVRLLRYDGWQGVRLGAWLVVRDEGDVRRYVVAGHGYYNRPIEDVWYDAGVATLFLACRGLGLSRTEGISDQTALHVLNGIEDKTTYVHRGCVADTWTGASAMLALFPRAAGRLEYDGESFGGGIGAMALSWDDRFTTARLRVPSFGHHPLRLTMRCVGSGDAVRRACVRHPNIYERTLRYFDAAVHAGRIGVPTHFACAAFDPSVPPPGQFAVHNAMRASKALTVWTTGHHAWAGTEADVRRARTEAEAFRRAYTPLAD